MRQKNNLKTKIAAISKRTSARNWPRLALEVLLAPLLQGFIEGFWCKNRPRQGASGAKTSEFFTKNQAKPPHQQCDFFTQSRWTIRHIFGANFQGFGAKIDQHGAKTQKMAQKPVLPHLWSMFAPRSVKLCPMWWTFHLFFCVNFSPVFAPWGWGGGKEESWKRGLQKRGPQSMSVSTMQGRYWISVSAFLFDSLPWWVELSHWFWRHRGSILNFRIGFLSSIGGRLPYPCLPTPLPILRGRVTQRGTGRRLKGKHANEERLGGDSEERQNNLTQFRETIWTATQLSYLTRCSVET